MVHFESSNLIEVTHQRDVVVGDMVKFIIPSEVTARVVRGLKCSQSPIYSPIKMLVIGLKTLATSVSNFWKTLFLGSHVPLSPMMPALPMTSWPN